MSARAAVTITFWQNGLLYGAWAARIPALRDRLDLSDGQVGIALACIAVGSIIGMPLAGRAAARWGFDQLGLDEIVSFTLAGNVASRGVMEQLGFSYDREVEHAGLPHVLYRLTNDDWGDRHDG